MKLFPASLSALALLVFSPLSHALSEEDFRQCVQTLGERAKQEGVSASVVDQHLDKLALQEKVIELDGAQPEFTASFANYYTRRVTEQRVEQGRKMLAEHRALLNQLTREYGVPGHYLMAFWGLETNYGGYKGNTPTLDALATLACEGRRGSYFSAELINGLRLLEENATQIEQMKGSWAGAMGHVQFMPANYLRYAVDRDGDGRRDLWNSIPDAMASAANFLQSLGWQEGQRWGREVRLPDGFDFRQAGLGQRLSLQQWANQGVRMGNGEPLAVADIQASLLIPSGHQGPAFLVYDNFRVIMGWNRSEAYAIAVGRLADRIAGGGKLYRAPLDAPRLSREQVERLQTRLNDLGHKAGDVDGLLGPGTRSALARYQNTIGMIADGFPGEEVLKKLDILD